MASNNMLYVLVGLILVCETTALSFLKEFALSGNQFDLLSGFGFYFLVNIFLIQSFRYEGMGIVNVLWSAFSVLLVVLTGMLLFGEHVGKWEMAGIALVACGVALLRSKDIQFKRRGGQCLHIEADDIPPRP